MNDGSMVIPVSVPEDVRKHLLAGEEVIAKISTWIWLDYYATNQRLIMFGESGLWWMWLTFGVFYALRPKRFSGAVEYSRISATKFVTYHPRFYIVAGLVIGLTIILLAVYQMAISLGSESILETTLFYILGIGIGALYLSRKWTYCQLQIRDMTEDEMGKWRLYLTGLDKGKKVRDFIALITQQARLPG